MGKRIKIVCLVKCSKNPGITGEGSSCKKVILVIQIMNLIDFILSLAILVCETCCDSYNYSRNGLHL